MHVVPDWVIGNVWPATVRFVDREVDDDAFEFNVTLMVPLPVPDVGATVAHVLPLEVDHEQFGPFAIIPTVPTPPPTANGLPSREESTVTLHGVGSWLIVKGWPPIFSVPLRGSVVELAAMVNDSATGPGPLPEAPEVGVIQFGPGTVS